MKISQWKCMGAMMLLGAGLTSHTAFGRQFKNVADVSLEFPVRYVTPEAVYFNGGTINGIRPGDRAWIVRDGQKLLQVEVKYVAEHSACCLLKTAANEPVTDIVVRLDDRILIVIPREAALKRTRPTEQPPEEKRAVASTPQKRPAATTPKRYALPRRTADNALNGQISMQAFGQHDQSAQRFDFIEPSVYLRLNFDRPAGLPLRLVTRLRASQNYRQLGDNDMQKQSALQRVYEIALEYSAPSTPVDIAVGRMLRNELRGAGYLDGLVLGYRFNDIWKAGVFAGTQPETYRYSFSPDEKKLGAFLQMRTAVAKQAELTLAATGVGQYFQQQVSREYLAAQADFTFGRQWYLNQYFEIDLNRAWRRQVSGNTINLSNIYFNATYYPRTWISVNAAYDARRLIRSWETRSLADSLFDQSLRQGWRMSLGLQPTALARISVDGGWQGVKDAPDVYSAGLSATVSNLWRGVGISGRLSFFGNALSAGYYPAVDVSRSFFGVVYATLGGGAYIYRIGSGGTKQSNPWERLRLDVNLTRRFFLSGTFENFHGDTMNFLRGFADLGWRF